MRLFVKKDSYVRFSDQISDYKHFVRIVLMEDDNDA